ncbi:hypothetical protein [Coraliomargarita parva]|uniref:hypothetical protein n=1 Tax=Coraliomargarita parva TaxID=3014050 RepID=UPI0022B4316D|nr:hypothetical protein [Coraliomargarita parva]
MNPTSRLPRLEFDTPEGRFVIDPIPAHFDLYALCIESENDHLELGRYCGINDAVIAVSRQETGYDRWDRIPPRELPFRVHDIACWKLIENIGTNHIPNESLATG